MDKNEIVNRKIKNSTEYITKIEKKKKSESSLEDVKQSRGSIYHSKCISDNDTTTTEPKEDYFVMRQSLENALKSLKDTTKELSMSLNDNENEKEEKEEESENDENKAKEDEIEIETEEQKEEIKIIKSYVNKLGR